VSLVLEGAGSDVLAAVTGLGLEGVVAKRSDSIYVSGDRSTAWQKMRVGLGQEFVVGGYSPGPRGFDSLLVGYYQGRSLMFAGKVRAGFTPAVRTALWKHLQEEQCSECPFANLPDARTKGRWGEGVTPADMVKLRWLRPRHVVQIGFVEWTQHGRLRHATYRGLRPDKKARDVKREVPGAD